jgi:RNA polymerase sigma factor (sigma-70 family)
MVDISVKNNFLADIESNRKILYKICHLYTNNGNDFSDLYQDIIFQLWKSYSTFRGDSKISSWIYRVSFNTALQFLKKDENRSKIEFISQNHYQIPDFVNEIDKDNLDLLKRLIQKLSDIEKAIITLYLDDYSHDDISNMIGISKTNVATIISRIKEKLRSMSNKINN